MSAFRQFLQCRRGAAAVEATLILPVLISMFLGMVELTAYIEASRKAMSATQTMADLVAQETKLDTSDMADIRAAADVIMNPLSPTGTRGKIIIASIGFRESDDAPVMLWKDDGSTGETLEYSKAAGLGSALDSVIMVRLEYSYGSPFGFLFTTRQMVEEAFARPRIARLIEYNGVTGADQL
jgi:Flp pilus assembly pilin Flp